MGERCGRPRIGWIEDSDPEGVTLGVSLNPFRVRRRFVDNSVGVAQRAKIKNISDDASGLTVDEQKKIKENKSPADTLKQGMGTGEDVDLLFAALATASGFDSRIVLAPNLGDIFFDKQLPNSYFVDPANIAVNPYRSAA